jgi:hypothetical protein
MRSLKELFGSYTSDPGSPAQVGATNLQTMSRVLVIPTRGGVREPLVSYELCRDVAECFASTCLVETIAPLPLLSFSSEKVSNDDLMTMIAKLNISECRVIIVEGVVQHGNLGNARRMSFGSTGPLVALAIEAAVLLPRPHSWVNSLASKRVACDCGATAEVREEMFCRVCVRYSREIAG